MLPSHHYDPTASDLAIKRIGDSAYLVLRSKALWASTQLANTFPMIEQTLANLIREFHALPAESQDAQVVAVEMGGRALHWEAITRLGIVVESLCSLLNAIEAYREERFDDIETALVAHDLDLLKVLEERRRRKIAYWEGIAAVPSKERLLAAGLDAEEARILHGAQRAWAHSHTAKFAQVRRYYTDGIHRLYLRWKHGYTVVSPHVSPIRVANPYPKLREDMDAGFAVVHRRRDGRVIMEVIRSNPDEIKACLAVARVASDLTHGLALAWTIELEDPESRTIVAELSTSMPERAPVVRAMEKWLARDADHFGMIDVLRGLVPEESGNENEQ